MNKPLAIVVHDGSFHADDVFAVAALLMHLASKPVDARVVRTRDSNLIRTADIVLDVGGVHDPEHDRFDHHQQGGAGTRPNGIPYASVGLMWRKYGESLAGSLEAAAVVDRRLIAPIDGPDNGVALGSMVFEGYLPYTPGSMVMAFNPTWRESNGDADARFFEAVTVATRILEREITYAKDAVEGYRRVRAAYVTQTDKRLIVLDAGYPWQDITSEFPEALFVIEPSSSLNWKAHAIEVAPFKNRKDMPAAWAGLRDEELARVSGVPDAVFCHRGLQMAVAKTKAGALALAQKAFEN